MLYSIFLSIAALAAAPVFAQDVPAYKNPNLPFEKRADDLLSRMTLEEKVSQLMNDSAPIDRLGVPAYNWWNECLHGVARAGRATVFPEAIGLAATWDTDFLFRVATAISDEARQAGHLRRADILDTQHQLIPRSALGPRHGNLWRGSLPHRPHGGCLHQRPAGRRPQISEDHRHRQALCRP
jgi:hypothetical protein